MNQYPAIYKNGKVQVIPLYTVVRIVIEGRVLDTYKVEDLEEAIRTADEIAQRVDELPRAA